MSNTASLRAILGLLLSVMILQAAVARDVPEGTFTSSRALLAPITVTVGDVKITSCKSWSYPTPCPDQGKFYYCFDSDQNAFNGCRPVSQNPFPDADCKAAYQCITNNT